MATLSDLQARLEQLKEVRDSGVLITMYEGRQMQFRNLDDLNQAITGLEAQVAALTTPATKPTRQIRLTYGGKDL